jgi:hypothetical protein
MFDGDLDVDIIRDAGLTFGKEERLVMGLEEERVICEPLEKV